MADENGRDYEITRNGQRQNRIFVRDASLSRRIFHL
jgi:hypothetical protein